jgi:hypothetical protein
MGRLSSAVHAAALSSAAAALCVVSGCGNDTASDEAAAGAADVHLAGSFSGSGKSGKSGGSNGSGGATASTKGGTSSTGGEENSAGDTSAVNAGSGATSNTAGGAPASGGASIQAPGPAPGGGSVYAVECSGETAMCGVERSHCLGINLDQGGVGYACSNQCGRVADCSNAPTGAAAEVGCVQFTKEKRCMLVCYDQPNEYACPTGMSCYIYPNSPIGYCLWTNGK